MKKVVFITGVSSGFGKTIAEHLSVKGFKVYGTSRKVDAAGSKKKYEILKMDVKDTTSVAKAVKHILEREGKIDVLVNNAGISVISPLEESSVEDMRDIMDTNVYGVLRLCRAVLPHMRQNKSGLIINISSIAGLVGLPFMGLYCTSKFALEGLTESLSMEVKPFGIDVCLVEPGDFNTDIIRNRKKRTPDDTSVYKAFFETVFRSSEAKMKNAQDPDKMGEFICRIINRKKPALRYKIGTLIEKLSPAVKNIIPGRMFENIMLSYFK